MTTATAPTVTKTYERTAKDERAHNIQINGDKALVEIKGTNTYPIKGLLSVFGGKWNKETQTWWVPDHKYHEAQTAADEQTKKQADRDAAKGAKSAPVKSTPIAPIAAAVAAPVQQAAPVAAPVQAAPVSTDRLVFRIKNLLEATTALCAATQDGSVKMALALAMDGLTLAGQEALAAAAK